MTYQENIAKMHEASDALLDSLDVALNAGSEACEILDEFQKEILQMLEELSDTALSQVQTKLKTIHAFVAGYNDGANLHKELAAQLKDGHVAHESLRACIEGLDKYEAHEEDTTDDDDNEDNEGKNGEGRPPAHSAPARLLKWPWRMSS